MFDSATSRPAVVPRTTCSINEAALSLGVSRRTVYTLIQGGQLRTVAAGRRRLVPIAELQRFAAPEPRSADAQVSGV